MSPEQPTQSQDNPDEARAKARKAEAEALKAEREVPSTAEVAAKARKAIAEAERDAAKAQKEQIAAMIPDFGAIKDSTLEEKQGEAFLAPFLTYGALDSVAQTIAGQLIERLQSARVLVTTDPDLASADGLYFDVTDGLDRLKKSADALLSALGENKHRGIVPGAAAAISAIVGAVPGILSLFSAKRTVTTGAATAPDALAAAAAVIVALQDAKSHDSLKLVLDDFRLVPSSDVHANARALNEERARLVEAKLKRASEQAVAGIALAKAQRTEKALEKEAEKNAEKNADLERVREEIESHQTTVDSLTREIAAIDALVTGVDSFFAAIGAVPAGGRRSLLTAAALHEQLHAAERSKEGGFTHVLLVKPQKGGSQQLLNNRPLWFEDKFSTLVEVGVTFVLISTTDSTVVRSGTVAHIVGAYGSVGEAPKLKVVTIE